MHQPPLGVQELQEEAEIRHRDKRKALMKLQKVRQPVRQVQTEVRVRQAWGVAAGGAQILLLLRGVSTLTSLLLFCVLRFLKGCGRLCRAVMCCGLLSLLQASTRTVVLRAYSTLLPSRGVEQSSTRRCPSVTVDAYRSLHAER